MRRARGLRLSSTRDVCVFCATHQLAATRRQLNSSSRSPSSAEGILYKDSDPPARPLSQAARMRQALAASVPSGPPAQPQGGYMTPAQRMRLSLGTAGPQQTQHVARLPPPPDRRAPHRSAVLDGPGRGQARDRFAPAAARRGGSSEAHQNQWALPQHRFKVNMDSRPPVTTPPFGSAHLRRRHEPQPARAQAAQDNRIPLPAARPAPRRALLDQDEIAKLLGGAVTTNSRPPKPYQPFAKDANAQRTCWHCGSTNHTSTACLAKPTLRAPQSEQREVRPTTIYRPPQAQPSPRHRESVADAAESWARKQYDNPDKEASAWTQENEDYARRNLETDRRRNRLEFHEPLEARNRYEQPERRQGGNKNRGRRIQRDAEDDDDRPVVNKQERKRLRAVAKKAAHNANAGPVPISLPEYISVANLAGALKLRVEDFVQKLEELGFEEVQNDHILNAEHAGLIAQEYNFEPIFQAQEDDGDLYPAAEIPADKYTELPARPPVVTVMGHVDHGKTTILDHMRSTSVAATEFGGITQHIGAFSVPLANGKKITFLDTPGHAAFETMRARGANVTDIVVLVVAADDSVMPQTVEAIKHAQGAKVPIIVAINKIDKPQADANAVKLDLGRHGIEIEDFGGDVQAICVSGKTGQGIADLEEAITTLSELLDHRADPEAAVEGWVLEGTTKKSGRVATVLVRSGTLRQGTALVAGTTWTRVRSIRNEAGFVINEVGPGMAVEVDGWRDQPIAGDDVLQAKDEQHATAVTDLRNNKIKREQMARDMDAINESRRLEAERRDAEAAVREAAAKGGEPVEEVSKKETGPDVVSFIIKGDVSGSVEAVVDSINGLGNAEVSTRILRHGVGPPSEFDIAHAADAQGHIVNFNTAVPPHVARLAEEKGVKVLDSNIIYRVVENIKELLSERLKPNVIQKVTGEVEVAVVFEISLGGRKKMKVAGSKVRNGLVNRGTKAKVLRGDEVVHDGVISTLKNQKKDVEQMRKDTECGISFEGWAEFKMGDRIQCYEERFEKRHL